MRSLVLKDSNRVDALINTWQYPLHDEIQKMKPTNKQLLYTDNKLEKLILKIVENLPLSIV